MNSYLQSEAPNYFEELQELPKNSHNIGGFFLKPKLTRAMRGSILPAPIVSAFMDAMGQWP